MDSIKNKIAQMLIMGFDGSELHSYNIIVKEIQDHNIGGVILFDYNYTTKEYNKNIINQEQLIKLNHQLTHYNKSDIPIFISVDHEGGKITRLKSRNGFNHTLSPLEVGKLSLEQVKESSDSMAEDLQNLGFNLSFAPIVDVNTNPENPIIAKLDRSYSSNPDKVIECSNIVAKSLSDYNIVSCYKHFPGHGSSNEDSHLGFVDVTNTWHELELKPYYNLKAPMVMTAHIVNKKLDPSGLPATLSKLVITDLLRKKLNYKNIIISDDMQMKAISEHYSLEEALVKSINAGVDMFIFGNQLVDKRQGAEEIIDIIYKNIQSNKISADKINLSYDRIIEIKEQRCRELKSSSL